MRATLQERHWLQQDRSSDSSISSNQPPWKRGGFIICFGDGGDSAGFPDIPDGGDLPKLCKTLQIGKSQPYSSVAGIMESFGRFSNSVTVSTASKGSTVCKAWKVSKAKKRSPPKRTPEIQRDRSYRTLKAFLPAYCAMSPSSSSILRSWLYFASLSERLIEPVLISPVSRATTRSAIVQSSVSPDL